ncbi:hypothetical protein, partial [Cryptosporidium parvum Iowa II]
IPYILNLFNLSSILLPHFIQNFIYPYLYYRIRVGESYYHASEDEATEKIEELKSQVEGRIEEISKELSSIQQEMDKLKVDLYLKFGSNINLDE